MQILYGAFRVKNIYFFFLFMLIRYIFISHYLQYSLFFCSAILGIFRFLTFKPSYFSNQYFLALFFL